MNAQNWAEIIALIVLLVISTPILGSYLARIYEMKGAPGDRFFLPIEHFVYRICRIDPKSEQRWRSYVLSLILFTTVGIVLTYAVLRLQAHLPGDPDHLSDVSPGLSFNTAMSFGTNTDWQSYAGESTISQFGQMFGLVWHQFISAAVGMALAAGFIRAIVRRRRNTIGNFWVDTIRSTTRVLVPICFVFAIIFMTQGVVQNFRPATHVTTVAAQATHHTSAESLQQNVAGGPVASMTPPEALGDNGGGYNDQNYATPFQNPNGVTDVLYMWLMAMIPFAFAWTYGKMIKNKRQAYVVLVAMAVLWLIAILIAAPLEARGNPKLAYAGVTQHQTAANPGGNLEGKDLRLGTTLSAVDAANITTTSTGGVNSANESYTPIGGAVPLFGMMLGEVEPGGTGTGLYGMLVFVLISVFIAGLMVGRTPEYLGKKLLAGDMKLAAVYILILPATVLVIASIAILMPSSASSISSTGPHGLTELVYAYTSAAHNNGSSFGGISANTDWYNATLGVTMWVGRNFEIIPALALAGSLVRKRVYAPTVGTLRTDTPLFTFILIAIVIVLVGLTYFPVLALGPLAEHFSGHFGL